MRSQEQMITLMSWQNVCADNILHYNESSCENFTSDLGKKKKKKKHLVAIKAISSSNVSSKNVV